MNAPTSQRPRRLPLETRLPGRHWGRVFIALLLAIGVSALGRSSAHALDVWLITNQHRILIVRDFDTTPTQGLHLTHPPVPGAYAQAFGAFAFAPNGTLYAISITLGTPSGLYTLDPRDGSFTHVGDFPFQWGNTLYFHPRTGRGYTGGGLESWIPYQLLNGFYVFENYDPATTTLWHDMRPDFPSGGYTVGYAHHDRALYALWGIGHMYAHTTYLLRITENDAGDFLDYTNLTDLESQGIPEGGWDLFSDGRTLYVVSPQALYAVDLNASPPAFRRVLTFDLEPGETVNAATAPWADLELGLAMSPTVVRQNANARLTVEVRNQGPWPAERVHIQVEVPTTVTVRGSSPSQGDFDPNTGLWQVGTLAADATARLTLTLQPQQAGPTDITAFITRASTLDPDSTPLLGPEEDDWGDALTDDDEDGLTFTVAPALPATGFAPWGRPQGLPPQKVAYQPTDVVLHIPRLGVEAPVVGVPAGPQGWDVTWLGHAVGWLQGSAFPTWPGNTVLTGHVWNADGTPGVFYGLEKLRYGDRVLLRLGEAIQPYLVVENRRLSPGAFEQVFPSSPTDVLTLLTCEGYDPAQDAYAWRRAVRAVPMAQP